ncbi:MAG: flippase-like domain-containing protein [Chitinophagaceae bacterium]|nr:flippase-like domain-containing protein [Chitinophagaceae bacterium]
MKKILAVLKYVFFLGAGIFLVWWQFHKMTPEQEVKFQYALSNVNFWLIIPIVLMSLTSHLSRSCRWKILIEPLGYQPLIINIFGVTMVGYLANSFVPRLGEILKCTLLGKYEKIAPQKLIGTIIIERIFDLICYLVFIFFTVLIQYKLVGGFVKNNISELFKNNGGVPVWIKLLIIVSAIVLIILFIKWLVKKYQHNSIVQKIKKFIAGLSEGLATIKNLKKRGWFLFNTLLIWSMYLLQIYIGFSAIKDVSHLGLDAACAVLTLATLAMIITPGGLGTFPTAVYLVSQLYKIDTAVGEAFGWLMWGVSTAIILISGLIFSGILFFINKKKHIEKRTNYSR